MVRKAGLHGLRWTAWLAGEAAILATALAELIGGAIEDLKRDPDLLFMLVESEWEDTRTFAFELLRTRIDVESLGLDGLIGLCDSNRVDVQDVGKELVKKHVLEGDRGLSIEDVLGRLVQHPHPNMRSFALDLAVHHLRRGAAELRRIEPLCRAILFDLWPDRRAKHLTIDLLAARGQGDDEEEAALAARLLSDYVNTQGRADFERVMEALVRIGLAYPGVKSAVQVKEGGA